MLQFGLVGGLWVAMLGLGAATLMRLRPWSRLSRRDLVALSVIALLGLGLRLWADPFPSDIRSASEMGFRIGGECHLWAAAYSALLHALHSVLGPAAETVFRANVVIGTLQVVALHALTSIYLEDREAGLAGAALLAVLPISARFSASDSAHVSLTLMVLLALLFSAAWAREGSWALLAQAVGWLALAANTRVEGLIFIPVAAGVAIAAARPPSSPARERRWGWLALIVVEALSLVFPVTGEGWSLARAAAASGSFAPRLLDSPWFSGGDVPWLFGWLSLLGLAALLAEPECRRRAFAWGVALAAASMPTLPSEDAWATNYRYFLPLLALSCLPAGRALAALARRLSRAAAAAGAPTRLNSAVAPVLLLAVALLAALPRLSFLRRQWTFQLEWSFAREHIRSLPDGCVILQPDPWEAGLIAGPALSLEAGRSHRWLWTSEFFGNGARDDCAVLYLPAYCFAQPSWQDSLDFGEKPECRRLRGRFTSAPLAVTELPALPYVKERYSRDPVPVGFYRLRRGDLAQALEGLRPDAFRIHDGERVEVVRRLWKIGRAKEALAALRELREEALKPSLALAVAELYVSLGQAREAFRVLARPEFDDNAHVELARARLLFEGRREEGLRALRRAGALAANEREALDVARVLRGVGRPADALSMLDRWAAGRGATAAIELERVELLAALGRGDEAAAPSPASRRQAGSSRPVPHDLVRDGVGSF